jgi:hypothetical protein
MRVSLPAAVLAWTLLSLPASVLTGALLTQRRVPGPSRERGATPAASPLIEPAAA